MRFQPQIRLSSPETTRFLHQIPRFLQLRLPGELLDPEQDPCFRHDLLLRCHVSARHHLLLSFLVGYHPACLDDVAEEEALQYPCAEIRGSRCRPGQQGCETKTLLSLFVDALAVFWGVWGLPGYRDCLL